MEFFESKFYLYLSMIIMSFKLTVSISANFEYLLLVVIAHVGETDIGLDGIEILLLLLANFSHF